MLYNDERRNFRRMTVDTEATIELSIDNQSILLAATCRDLSATGMNLYVEQAIDPGVTATVHIESSGGAIPPLKALTRVVRCSQDEDGQYCVGVEMLDIN
ncbi:MULTISPECIES: PilZ domain-containing protein [Pseudoalteromonas]|uniref:PilZ domain-containing protein n=1 Tax=Pseudoalteromonas qingdaonensis TaxID=3131913 RepID=A0ABU9MWK1_9GAMM